MILNDNSVIKNVEDITPQQEQRILDFLQGAVYSWCNTRKDERFALRNFMGGDNFFWEGTPMVELYNKNEAKLNDSDAAFKEAGIDGGWLLKKMIASDKRKFETKKEVQGPRHYMWVDNL